jgi:hypothetical protein
MALVCREVRPAAAAKSSSGGPRPLAHRPGRIAATVPAECEDDLNIGTHPRPCQLDACPDPPSPTSTLAEARTGSAQEGARPGRVASARASVQERTTS